MNKKPKDQTQTKTTEFEVEGVEEAWAPAPGAKNAQPGQPWRPAELPPLKVETPPELQDREEHTARIWILERRARGMIAQVKRWFVGKSRR